MATEIRQRFVDAIMAARGVLRQILVCWLASYDRPHDYRQMPFLLGAAGMAKTTLLREAAALITSNPVIEVILARQDSGSSVLGFNMPITSESGETSMVFVPSNRILGKLKGLDQSQPIVLIFDEITQTAGDVMAAVTGMLTSNEVEGHAVGTNVLFGCAGNGVGDGCNASDLPLMMYLGRVQTIKVECDDEFFESWIAWAMQADEVDEQRIHPRLLGAIMSLKRLDGGAHNPIHYSTFCEIPPAEWKQGYGPRPSPRSLYKLSKLMFEYDRLGLSFPSSVGEGAVGPYAWEAYWAYMQFVDQLPSLADIMADPGGAQLPQPHEVAMSYAICGLIVSGLAREYSTGGWVSADKADNIIAYLKRMPAEFGAIIISNLMSVNPDMISAPSFDSFKQELDPLA